MFFIYVIRGNDRGHFSGPFSTHEAAQDTATQILSLTQTGFAVHIYDRERFLHVAGSGGPSKTSQIAGQAFDLAAKLGLLG